MNFAIVIFSFIVGAMLSFHVFRDAVKDRIIPVNFQCTQTELVGDDWQKHTECTQWTKGEAK